MPQEELFDNNSEKPKVEVKSGTLKKKEMRKMVPKPVKVNRTFIDK